MIAELVHHDTKLGSLLMTRISQIGHHNPNDPLLSSELPPWDIMAQKHEELVKQLFIIWNKRLKTKFKVKFEIHPEFL